MRSASVSEHTGPEDMVGADASERAPGLSLGAFATLLVVAIGCGFLFSAIAGTLSRSHDRTGDVLKRTHIAAASDFIAAGMADHSFVALGTKGPNFLAVNGIMRSSAGDLILSEGTTVFADVATGRYCVSDSYMGGEAGLTTITWRHESASGSTARGAVCTQP